MYSPNLVSRGFHDLWLEELQPAESSLVPEQRKQVGEAYGVQHLRSLFAPPLLAYSIESSGPNITQLDYLIRTKSLSGSTIRDNALFLPLIVKNMNKLQRISRTGSDTIVPIGINKTMAQIEYEESRRHNSGDSSHMASRTHDNDNDNEDEEPPVVGNANNSILEEPIEVDLDADIPEYGDEDDDDEADITHNHTQYPLDDDDDDEDEGFMAEDVEYQDDHSISMPMNGDFDMPTAMSTSSIVSAIQRDGLHESDDFNENDHHEHQNENAFESRARDDVNDLHDNSFDRTEDESMDMALE